jgi:hypothetical protein
MARSNLYALQMALVVLAAVATAVPGQGAVVFVATLDASQNVPPTESPATGAALLVLNDAETEVAYTVTYSGLMGSEVGAHFHNAPPGENGSILHTLPMGTPKVGVWDVSLHDVGELYAGRIYVNVHSTAYFSGEIRGDITESLAAAIDERQSWSRIKALYQ